MTLTIDALSTYAARRERARELGRRFDFAEEPLRLYLAVAETQERVFARAHQERPSFNELSGYVVRVALPGVMEAAVAAGTEKLREATLVRFHDADLEGLVEAWLEGSDQDGTDAFLARASAQPVLEALPELAAELRTAGAGERSCPTCGGAPQLAVLQSGGSSNLDSGSRQLLCANCLGQWTFRRVLCPHCGEEDERRLAYFQSPAYAHLRVDACETCRHYVKSVDLGRLGLAVPLVDEIAGAPLDLWASEHGYQKVELNLVGL
jgi:FdhE protein